MRACANNLLSPTCYLDGGKKQEEGCEKGMMRVCVCVCVGREVVEWFNLFAGVLLLLANS